MFLLCLWLNFILSLIKFYFLLFLNTKISDSSKQRFDNVRMSLSSSISKLVYTGGDNSNKRCLSNTRSY